MIKGISSVVFQMVSPSVIVIGFGGGGASWGGSMSVRFASPVLYLLQDEPVSRITAVINTIILILEVFIVLMES